GSQAQSLAGSGLVYAAQLEHHPAGLYNGHPILGGAFTGTHSGFSGLLGDGLVGENLDPDLTETLAVTGHGHTGGLNLVGGNPSGLQGLQAKIAVGHLIAAQGLALHAASLNSAVFHALRE